MKYYSLTGRRNHSRPLKRLLDTWDRKGSTSGPTPWNIHYDDNNNKDNNRARIHSNIESKTGHISVHTHTHTHTHTISLNPMTFTRVVGLHGRRSARWNASTYIPVQRGFQLVLSMFEQFKTPHTVTGFPRHITFEIKSHDYSFTYQKQGSSFLHQFWCGSVRLYEEISLKFTHKNISFTNAQWMVYIIPLLGEKVPHLWRQSHQFPWLPGFHQQMATARYMELTLTSFPWLPGLRGYDRICLEVFTKNVVINELLNKWRHIWLFCFMRRAIIN